jgi:hypothetical protein
MAAIVAGRAGRWRRWPGGGRPPALPADAAPQYIHGVRRRSLLVALAGLVAVLALADELIEMSIKDYFKRRDAATSRDAYQRTVERMRQVRLGMRTDQFFDKLEMLVVKDKKGRGLDGFVEGYLKDESQAMGRGKEPDKYLVFGYHENVKKRKDPVRKFYAVFRDNVLLRVAFFDPAEGAGLLAAIGGRP